jgi:dTDP-4-amino-4,6-dideoxygalactose transaminase
MVLTDDDRLAEKVRMLHGHGSAKRDRYELAGFNSRLDSIQAAVLEIKLGRLDEWNGMRRRSAALYREHLSDLEEIRLRVEPGGHTHVYNQFTLMAERRDELRRFLEERGIGTMVYYSRALHRQPVFSDLGCGAGDFPVSEKAAETVLSLPIYPGLPEESVRTVATAIHDFYRP